MWRRPRTPAGRPRGPYRAIISRRTGCRRPVGRHGIRVRHEDAVHPHLRVTLVSRAITLEPCGYVVPDTFLQTVGPRPRRAAAVVTVVLYEWRPVAVIHAPRRHEPGAHV